MRLSVFQYFLFGFFVQGWCGELSILRSPSSLQFNAANPPHMQDLVGVYSSALGLSKDQKWPGLNIKDEKTYPEAIATLILEGGIEFNNTLAHYKLKSNHELKTLQEGVKKSLTEFFPQEKITAADIDLETLEKSSADHPSFLQQLPQGSDVTFIHLSKNNPAALQLGREIQTLLVAASKISEEKELNNKISDVFWFHIRALKPIVAQYGENSPEVEEARNLIRAALSKLEEAFQNVYGTKFILAVLSLHQHHHSRHTRAADKETDRFAHLNLSKEYGGEYSAIFNIILWTSVALIWVLIATAAFIGNMDPGRDSVIYRMTSQRMKKDN